MKIKYNDRENFEIIDDYQYIDFEKVCIIGMNLSQSTAGFDIYDDDEILIASYPEHKVVYDIGNNFIIYTNDTFIYYVYYLYDKYGYVTDISSTRYNKIENGIIVAQGQGKAFMYPAPEKPLFDENEIPNFKIVDGEVVEIQDDEKIIIKVEKEEMENQIRLNQLKILKDHKINESKYSLASFLATHPLESSCHGGQIKKYTVTSEKQSLMANHYMVYNIAKQMQLNPVLKWNATGAESEEWTEEEFIQLMLEIKAYVEPLVALQQEYEITVNNCTTQEELDLMNIDYNIIYN